MDYRVDPRRPTDVAVRFLTRPSQTGSGRILNVSATGAFLETTAPLSYLSLLYLQPLELSPAGAAGRIAATVVRRAVNGFGLEWCEFGAASTPVYAILASSSCDLGGAGQLALELPSAPCLPRTPAGFRVEFSPIRAHPF
ncbi:MAG TPA: hypothetical protein VKP66_16225 [Steroidobacteraceae bacterium]|nr:hypothetical protein [Steroidobacteraceae bacterium]